ncbi:penicillin-binding protein 1C [Variovorax dokdonensis]|uniref:peptidoglycan glycosyltransferase n=1 Tax=Variovorax dokdonensis TaxID=344883 RepID=A0ABT7NDZ3_9BURK|nr:penicillin-binding protein 1C [Variovorax dokdonensis]MDM0046149.1 penicillin-binding protein 1C [Variovorax dokdonensis]
MLACAAACATGTSFEEVRAGWRPSYTMVQDRNGEPLQRVRTDFGARRGAWVSLAEVSPALRAALLYSEDRRFWEHSGVDWQAVPAAAWGNLWHTRTRGASTITMQLVGLLDDNDAPGRRDIGQKLDQAIGALQLERSWRKDQILEAYLNLLPLRGELVGIDALSRQLFGKAPHGLNARESAVTAALVRAPNAAPTVVARRACEIWRTADAEHADCAALAFYAEAVLRRREFAPSAGDAPHAARQGLRVWREAHPDTQQAPEQLRTTLSAPLQRMAVALLDRQLRELRDRNVRDGAVVVLDNASGNVLAWVGSSGKASRAPEVDTVLARRQPGSTLKPFLYEQAIEQQRLTAASLLDDSSAQIPTPGGLYIPQNYDRQFKGLVSVRTALAASLNVPAVRTLVAVTPDAFARRLVALGLPLDRPGDHYGYSLALGSAEVTLLSLTNAFRTLANGGRYAPTRLLPGDPSAAPTQVMDERAAFIVGDILSDPNARIRTFGLDSLLATPFWSAVKTGTSKDMRDNWAVGFSERYTIGVWVGNANGEPMWDVSGVSGAAPVWSELMRALHRELPSHAPARPQGVVRSQVKFGPVLDGTGAPIEAARGEWFVAGTEQAEFIAQRDRPTAPDGATETARIARPAPGTLLALDPDIPPSHQRLRLEAIGLARDASSAQQVQWRIGGRTIASGAQAQWLPWPGRHTLELADAQGRVLDQVQFEVRGAGVVAGAAMPAAR